MHQIKVFKVLEHDHEALEKDVNAWLSISRARVIQIVGNIAPQGGGSRNESGMTPSDILVVILYETP